MPVLSPLAAVAAIFVSIPALAPPHPTTAHPGKITRLVMTQTGNEARYRVREQLARVDFPNDAIGRTPDVSGAIVFDDNGAVLPDQSVITVDLRGLKSDRDRRDGYVQRNTLETEKYPAATFQVTAINGLAWPLPITGAHPFTIAGDLTIHGVTHPVTWKVMSVASDSGFTGTASTQFTFADVGLKKPSVMMVLSVDDQITLELDFHFVKQ